MPAAAIDGALQQQAGDVIYRSRGSDQHRGADTRAEVARLGNDTYDDEFGRGFASQPQMRERLLKPRIVGRQTKLGPASQKVGFAVDAQCSRLLFRMNSVGDHDQVSAVQIWREIQPRRTEVDNFNV